MNDPCDSCEEYHALEVLSDDQVIDFLKSKYPTSSIINAINCNLSARLHHFILVEVSRRWMILNLEDTQIINLELLQGMLSMNSYNHSNPLPRDKPSLENKLAQIFTIYFTINPVATDELFLELFSLLRYELINATNFIDMYELSIIRNSPNVNRVVYQTIAKSLYAYQTNNITQVYRFPLESSNTDNKIIIN
jgi:hypothetical protein